LIKDLPENNLENAKNENNITAQLIKKESSEIPNKIYLQNLGGCLKATGL
jgi:hypothetical protein